MESHIRCRISTIRVTQLFLLCITIQLASSDGPEMQDDITKEILQAASLPEIFSDDKLPYRDVNATECFRHIGCLERIPDISGTITDPLAMGTEFVISNKEKETTIVFQQVLTCLLDTNECNLYPFSLQQLQASKFNPNHKTIIITAGYRTKCPCTWQKEVRDSWHELEDTNVIMVSWNKGNHALYGTSSLNTKLVGRQITVMLYYLALMHGTRFDDRVLTENIYLIGHSLGAHISGFVGQELNGKVGRITGLDPAGPYFNELGRRFKLDRTDAIVVDAIHTNGGNSSVTSMYFGMKHQVGHVDFMANDGRKQPGCNFDVFGCSHKIAPDFYLAFLEHELKLRDFLDKQNHNCHRLFAIASQTYESFHNGSSLSERCPITTLNDGDLLSPDVTKCTIPVDFISKGRILRNELEEKYGVDFTPENYPATRYFFYTREDKPFLNNHNLIRIRITKEKNLDDSKNFSEMCDIHIEIPSPYGKYNTLEHKVLNYKLIDQGDHYEVVVPYLPPDFNSKYALAELDYNDFYLNESNRVRLIEGIGKFFPNSFRIKGLGALKPVHILKEIGASIAKAFRSLLGFRNDSKGQSVEKKHDCNVKIETVVIQPLKKLHRHMVAAYTLEGRDKESPDVKVLERGDISPVVDLFSGNAKDRDSDAATNDPQLPQSEEVIESEVFIDTVILGPYDDDIDERLEPDDEEEKQANQEDESTSTKVDSSSVSGAVWLSLTLMLAVVLSVAGFLAYRRWWKLLAYQKEDRRELINEDDLFTIT